MTVTDQHSPAADDTSGAAPLAGDPVSDHPAAAPLLAPPADLDLDPQATSLDTLTGIGLRQARRLAEHPCLYVTVRSAGTWHPVTWAEMHRSAVAVAAGLVQHGVQPGDRVAILSENRLEWIHADTGSQLAAAIVVPIYASSTAEMTGQILQDSGAVAVFCSSPTQAAKVAEARRATDLTALRLTVVFEGAAEDSVTLAQFAAAGTPGDVGEVAARLRTIGPDDDLTIIYTSGTTGVPKGVVLTHANAVMTCRAMLDAVGIRPDDHALTFLPWAHVYERAMGLFAGMIAGVTASIAPDLDHVAADLREVSPTLMNGVPRLYEKMQEAIIRQIRSPGGRKAALGLRALDDCVEAARLRRGGKPVPVILRLRTRLWDRLVISRIREGLGGRMRMFSSGGGPINLATLEFFDALGIGINEGYGLTETTGGITANDPGDPHFGTVGRATAGSEIRIAEDGEVLVKGPGVMKGYFNNPQATAEVFSDGWFLTGDIGELEADGYLRITDRKKDLIVTAGGKNIAPQPIEAAIAADPLVERAVVIGDRRKYLVALVVPDFGALQVWASANGVEARDDEALAGEERVRELYGGIVEKASSRLARYETIKRVAVLGRDLDEEHGELTPSLKVKRRRVMENFAAEIEALYASPERVGWPRPK